MKILVIDDSTMAVDVTVGLLNDAGHEAQGLNQPTLAMTKLRELKPDLLVCDVMMPEVNGFEICKAVRKDEAFANMPIVMASAKAYEADREKAKKMGANGYIVKPFTMDKFEAVIQTLGSMRVSAWGVRGTLPMPQQGYIRFGGNTSCYSLQFSPTRHLVFDAGSGIKAFGDHLLANGHSRVTADLFITHPHWD
ncbi:MAG: response regulator, partial [Xanthomonadales bacterium]|nr:response regulator [Xanthomonadales bacterium]